MDALLRLINELTSDPQTTRIIFVLLVAGAFFITVLALLYTISGFSTPLKRRMTAYLGVQKKEKNSGQTVAKIAQQASGLLMPPEGWEKNQTRERLVHAGFNSESGLSTFYGTKVVLGIVGLIIAYPLLESYSGWTTERVLFATAAAGFVGMMIPSYILDKLVEKRKKSIRNAFPDMLDLLVVCVESGLALQSAIKRVAEEMLIGHPELGAELELVNFEIRAGVDRVDALKNLAARTGLEDIRGLVSLLSQSMRFGTSIASTLRVYSEEFRDKRMQLAEEEAAKVGTKMIFPLVLCMFPSFFLVAIGPAIVGVLDAFGQ